MGQRTLRAKHVKDVFARRQMEYLVNPKDANAFASINTAFAAGDAELSDDVDVVVRVLPGVDHALDGGALVLPAERGLIIVADAVGRGQRVTRVVGNITLTDADAESKRRQLLIRNVDLSGNVVGAPNWEIRFESSKVDGTITRTHGTGKCHLYFYRCTGDPLVTDALGGTAEVIVRECDFSYLMTDTVIFSILASSEVHLINSKITLMTNGGVTNALCDFGGAASGQLSFYNSTIHVMKLDPADPLELFDNVAGTTQVYYYGLDLYLDTDSDIDMNSGILQEYGSPAVRSEIDALRDPVSNPPTGTTWTDPLYGETLTWDGVYWDCGGGVKRHELLVAIGVAAADHDCVWDPPADASVLRASCKLEKDLTGAGGAVKAGLGTKVAGDPDKYALTATLLADAADQSINPTYSDGGGDDLGVTGCDAAGAALGTLAGSDEEDVRVIVWFMPTVPIV